MELQVAGIYVIHKLAVKLLLTVNWGYRIGIDDSNYAAF
jgi:hypothetical protein